MQIVSLKDKKLHEILKPIFRELIGKKKELECIQSLTKG